MAFKIVLFLLQLLTFKDVISYSGHSCEYILAYIPIEEFAILANAQIEVPALTSSNIIVADGIDVGTALYVDDIVTSYIGGLDSRKSSPQRSSPSCSVCSQSCLNTNQGSNTPTITILPPVAVPQASSSNTLPLPSCELPLPSCELPLPSYELPLSNPTLPLPSCELPLPSYELPLSNPILHLPSSELPLTSSTLIDQYAVEETLTEIDYISSNSNLASCGNSPLSPNPYQYASLSQPGTVPIYGKKIFNGMVPAYGKVSIYGSSY